MFDNERSRARGLIRTAGPALRALGVCGMIGAAGSPGAAETISSALARTYSTNPDINAQRATARATDENVATAKSGYRPQASFNGSIGFNRNDGPAASPPGSQVPGSVGVNVTQTIFNGNMTSNRVRQAESQVFASRETLRGTEQTELLNGATAYMNVLRDTAILELNRNNVTVLLEQLRETRLRFTIQEVTLTDVAQAETSLASARSQYLTSVANLQNSIANYKQVIGIRPTRLEAARPVFFLVPQSVGESVAIAFKENPTIQSALQGVDVALLQVQINEGGLYPTLSVTGSVNHSNTYSYVPHYYSSSATATAQLSVPIYTGGSVDSSVRQAKEQLVAAELNVELQRRTVEAGVVSAYSQYVAARGLVRSSQVAVQSAEIALNGIRYEASVGQRTTFDILFAQQTLLNARTSLVSAEHDEVVGSYAVAAAIGWLSATRLGLAVVPYDPTIHFTQVKDKWSGLRTPDGR